ncbi:sigma-54 dependent transcriptional regulator [Desulfopila sp. IMCC35008]|uniref:sigma-54-dependent transcriptional regulator n=1 Tax=Desulfopila sp. IMCC35008 TaxID=2653858 RepID=UPI0013D3EEDC|nr:sigma-54 dependent transcriptional regulator [Desulfopila sp. IMCC35008]
MALILIIDDDEMLCGMVCKKLRHLEHDVEVAHTLEQGFRKTGERAFDLVLLDVRLPDGSGIEALPRLKHIDSKPEIIIITGEGDPDGAELAIETGAWDYILKPLSVRELSLQVTRALEYRKEKLAEKPVMILKRNAIIGSDPKLLACLKKVAKYTGTDISVLITGETGTGKELFARAVHENSRRATFPFVVLDCAAFPEQLVESILFGHEKGAFTGADQSRDGLILQADKGTLFMDEVGELPLSMQKTFLRVLQEKNFRPVGGKQELHSNFRLITATNRDLEQMVNEGKFRQDLLYRLKASTIKLPTLHERASDIETLVLHYVGLFCKSYNLLIKGVSAEFMDLLKMYHWPGNVRELANVIDLSIANSHMYDVLLPIHLPTDVRISTKLYSMTNNGTPGRKDFSDEHLKNSELPSLSMSLEETEKRYMRSLVHYTEGNIQEACRISGLSRSSLYARLKKYNIDRFS